MIASAGFTVTPHPHHARLRHVAIEADAIRAFFARVHHVDVQNLEYVPFMRFVMARRSAASCRIARRAASRRASRARPKTMRSS